MDRPPVRGRKWSPEDDENLRVLIARRQTVAAMARALGRTIDAVRGRASALGLQLPSPLRPWRPGVARRSPSDG
jgi:hypothetical protein